MRHAPPSAEKIRRRSHAIRLALAAALVAAALVPRVAPTAAQDLLPAPIQLVNPAAPSATEEGVPLPLPAAELTLGELESMALAANPAVGRALALVGAARANALQVGLRPNPSVGYEGQQIGSGGQAEQHGVLFGQEIVTGGKLQLNRVVASREVEIAEQELEQTRTRVLTDVRIAYFRVLVGQRQIAQADELVDLSREVSTAVDALHRAQEVGRVDVLQAKLEREQSEITSQTARNRLDAAWRELAAVVGNPRLPFQRLAGDPTSASQDIQFDGALDRLLASSPEIAAAAAEMRRARAALARAQVEPIPNVTFQGLVNWQDNGIGGKPDGGVALSVPLPIFNRNQGAILKAQREVLAANQAIAQLELQLQERLAPVFENYVNASQQTMRYRESILPAAEEALRLTRELYRTGEINYTELLTVQRTFAVANRDYLDAVLRLRIAEAEIEGLLLEGSLRQGGGRATWGP